jgi:hypothetical protein
MTSHLPEGFYCRYLRQLGERRAAEGKPPSAILDFDRFPEITRDEEHPEYGLVKSLPPEKRRLK